MVTCLTRHAGLVFEYTYQYPPSHWSQYLTAIIVYAINAVVNDRHDPWQRAYLFYYIQVGQKARTEIKSTAINGTMRALLALAHDKKAITSAEAVRFIEQFRDEDCVNADEETKVNRNWAVDIDLAADDSAAANVDLLSNRFEEITLFNEFTEGLL